MHIVEEEVLEGIKDNSGAVASPEFVPSGNSIMDAAIRETIKILPLSIEELRRDLMSFSEKAKAYEQKRLEVEQDLKRGANAGRPDGKRFRNKLF